MSQWSRRPRRPLLNAVRVARIIHSDMRPIPPHARRAHRCLPRSHRSRWAACNGVPDARTRSGGAGHDGAGVGRSRGRQVASRSGHGRASRELGFVTLQGACFEADRAHPYGPVLDLVRVLSTTVSPAVAAHYFAAAAAELVTLFPELGSIFPDTAPGRCWIPRRTGAGCSTS